MAFLRLVFSKSFADRTEKPKYGLIMFKPLQLARDGGQAISEYKESRGKDT